MNPPSRLKRFLLWSMLWMESILLQAQVIGSTPGPANLDTTQLAHIYFLRDRIDEFPDNWLGVTINNNHGMCVKSKMNSITIVHTALKGSTNFHTTIGEIKVSISLELAPGQSYYVELFPERISENHIRGNLRILSEAEALKRINAFPFPPSNRYCILPFDGEHDFRENVYPDTVHWFASEALEYRFKPLQSWEIIVRSKLRTVLAFRNDELSRTYSEAGGILYQPLSKCKSDDEFEIYCREKFIPSTLIRKRDELLTSELKKVKIHDGIQYARLVKVESRTMNDDAVSETSSLFMRSVYVVFFHTDEKGKGISACLYTSERGLEPELHSMDLLEKRIMEAWDSFCIVRKQNMH